VNRQAQAAVLFLTGGAILHAALTDLYLRYVKAGLAAAAGGGGGRPDRHGGSDGLVRAAGGAYVRR
jgi:hypothetical protein